MACLIVIGSKIVRTGMGHIDRDHWNPGVRQLPRQRCSDVGVDLELNHEVNLLSDEEISIAEGLLSTSLII